MAEVLPAQEALVAQAVAEPVKHSSAREEQPEPLTRVAAAEAEQTAEA